MEIDLRDFNFRLIAIAMVIVLGLVLGKTKRISEQTNKQIVNLLLMVFMPAALFSAFPDDYSDASMQMFISGLFGGVVVMISLLIVARIVFNKWFYRGEMQYESQFAFIFNNATFLGYPIVQATFGERGMVPYCGFIVAFNVALFSYGVFLFERKMSWKLVRDTVFNPNIIAVLAGMTLFLMDVRVPVPINKGVELIAGATTVLSLICIGYMLSSARFLKLIRKWRLFVTAAVQLTLGPLVTYYLLRLLNCPEEVVVVCTLMEALPTATSLGLFAKKYGGDEVGASELVIVSTILSAVSLPMIVSLLLVG